MTALSLSLSHPISINSILILLLSIRSSYLIYLHPQEETNLSRTHSFHNVQFALPIEGAGPGCASRAQGAIKGAHKDLLRRGNVRLFYMHSLDPSLSLSFAVFSVSLSLYLSVSLCFLTCEKPGIVDAAVTAIAPTELCHSWQGQGRHCR